MPSGSLRPQDWAIVLRVQSEQLHDQVWSRNLLCRRPAQLERKSLSVSARRLATIAEAPHIPVQGGSPAPRPLPCCCWTLRVQQCKEGKGPGGTSGPPGSSMA